MILEAFLNWHGYLLEECSAGFGHHWHGYKFIHWRLVNETLSSLSLIFPTLLLSGWSHSPPLLCFFCMMFPRSLSYCCCVFPLFVLCSLSPVINNCCCSSRILQCKLAILHPIVASNGFRICCNSFLLSSKHPYWWLYFINFSPTALEHLVFCELPALLSVHVPQSACKLSCYIYWLVSLLWL